MHITDINIKHGLTNVIDLLSQEIALLYYFLDVVCSKVGGNISKYKLTVPARSRPAAMLVFYEG